MSSYNKVSICQGIFILLFLTQSISFAGIQITGIIDGDTLKAELENVPEPLNKISIRIRGVDTPEIKGQCDSEKQKAQAAKITLKEWLKVTENISLQNLKWDKYGGRVLADVFFDKISVSGYLIDKGLAVPYFGEKKTFDWCAY